MSEQSQCDGAGEEGGIHEDAFSKWYGEGDGASGDESDGGIGWGRRREVVELDLHVGDLKRGLVDPDPGRRGGFRYETHFPGAQPMPPMFQPCEPRSVERQGGDKHDEQVLPESVTVHRGADRNGMERCFTLWRVPAS